MKHACGSAERAWAKPRGGCGQEVENKRCALPEDLALE